MKKSTLIKIIKGVTTGIVGYGTKIIVDAIIENNVTPDNFRQKISLNSTTWVISGMAAEATKKYTDARIDDFFENYLKVKEITDEIKEELKNDQIPALEAEVSVNSDI